MKGKERTMPDEKPAKPKMSIPLTIKLSQIDPKWKAYAAKIGEGRRIHVKSWLGGGDYGLCGIGGRGVIVDRPIDCKTCIKRLIQLGRLQRGVEDR